MTEKEKLYKLDRYGRTTIKIPFNPMLLAVLGYYNTLTEADKPDLEEVKKNIELLEREIGGKIQ